MTRKTIQKIEYYLAMFLALPTMAVLLYCFYEMILFIAGIGQLIWITING